MARHSSVCLAALGLFACHTDPPRETPSVHTASPPIVADAAAAAPTEAASEGAFLVRGPKGELTVVRAAKAADATSHGEVVCALGASTLVKLSNPGTVLSRLERRGPASLFVKLDGLSAPNGEEARREGLRAAGANPQTVSGDVATVLVGAEQLGALLAVPWVTSIEAPGLAVPR